MDRTGTIILVNAQVERLFGHARQDLLGQSLDVLVPERFRTRHRAFRLEFFSDPKTRAMGAGRELYGLRKDGTEVPVEIGLTPLHTSDGDFVLSSVVDITGRREMERLRSDFISMVSHELRTPLTSILGSLALVQSGALGILPEGLAAMVEIAHQNSVRLTRIINDILDIGKAESGKLDVNLVDMALLELLEQALVSNRPYAQKYGVRFVLQPGAASGHVVADPDRVMQVMANLLSNAAKFSPSGSDVRVRLNSLPTMMRVEVEDSGPGIAERFRPHVFEKFSQADASSARRHEGTGLGLSIARELVVAMGGVIGFDTVEGRGSTFYFELPRSDSMSTTPLVEACSEE